jgi:tetratricopeptide (TPR) repeat protein
MIGRGALRGAFTLLLIIATTLFAQEQPKKAPETPPAAPPPASPSDEAFKKLRALRTDPPAYVDALVKFLNEFPQSRESDSGAYMLRDAVRRAGNDPQKTRSLVTRFVDGTSKLPEQMRLRFYSQAVTILLANDLAPEAESVALRVIPFLNEKAYVDFDRRRHDRDEEERKRRFPASKSYEFSVAEQTERYYSFASALHASLGTSYLKQNKLELADKAFREAHRIKPDMESAVGIAEVLEKQNRISEAFEFMTFAMLTGRLKPEGIEHFHALYRKTHNGSVDGVEAYLDDMYRKRDRNPLPVRKYTPAPSRSSRVVLAELITGGGCIPCIPIDYSFEAALKEYSRRELILLVYHMHAPVSDPLSNHSAENRLKYYDVNSAPTAFLDGTKFNNPAAPRTVELATSKTQIVHDALASHIGVRLTTPEMARLDVKTVREGQNVKVRVNADRIKETFTDVTLHLVLVEEEVSYSGENGLRFHPMVVRNLARKTPAENYGFAIDPSKLNTIEYVFNTEKIVQANLLYYDQYPVERKQELSARLDKETLDSLNFSFREKRHQMDVSKLAVVAFVQDNKTKQILQAAFERVTTTPTP